MTSETVYSVELVSRMTYLSANSSRGTYTGTLRRNVPSIPVTTGECPFSVPPAGAIFVGIQIRSTFHGRDERLNV
ncbi:hypothetical protein RCH11_001371 [Glaciihabitans sp. GrIS 2.15]|nr:hypothetical protein [Glaciihabitans sp. GrIS 2.15]